MAGDITPYLDLITGEHRDKANFIAALSAALQPFADQQAISAGMPGLFDLDAAVGSQLDAVGRWVGRSRRVDEEITGVYFSFDTPGQGFDEAIWFRPGQDPSFIIELPDGQYRTLLRATIGRNHWSGTIPDAYDILNSFFNPLGLSVVVEDFQNMTMKISIRGTVVDAVTAALFNEGFLDLRPAGVGIDRVIALNPIFSFGPIQPDTGGFGSGYFVNSP